MIEIGIDEAGYGPLLGPLVVSAWGVKRRDPDEDLWEALHPAVSRKPGGEGVTVADSKQVYSPRGGLRRLEETVLTFLEVSAIEAESYRMLLSRIVPEDVRETEHLWSDPSWLAIPVEADAGEVTAHAFRLRSVMESRRVAPAYACSRVVSPRRFNEGIASTGNKQTTLFSHVAWLIRDAVARTGGELTRVTVDKIGSTRRYVRILNRFLGGWAVEPQREERGRSTYRVSHQGGRFELSFVREGDQTEFLVALASMQSKYLREVEMKMFNAFWKREAPRVAPTAGYYTDGKRFLTEIRPHVERIGLAEKDFVRVR